LLLPSRRRHSTGKERDDETGLDYFGARYYSGAQGRFTSPDSTAYSKLGNPQSWNLYAYSFNNPLKFIDPTGNEVQLANCDSEADCQKSLDAIRGSVGNGDASGRIGIEKIKRGWWGRIFGSPQYRINISGDMESFKALGQNAAHLGQLVENRKIATFEVADRYERNDGANPIVQGGIGLTPSLGYDPSQAVVHNNPSGFDPDTSGIINGGFGTIPGVNIYEATAHELLGHIWGEIVASHRAGSPQNFRDSIDAENAVRGTDPSRGLKIQHHHAPQLFSPQELQKMMKIQ
jgi:RHS repeat-associated protein